MLRLAFEPGASGWMAQTSPLSYVGHSEHYHVFQTASKRYNKKADGPYKTIKCSSGNLKLAMYRQANLGEVFYRWKVSWLLRKGECYSNKIAACLRTKSCIVSKPRYIFRLGQTKYSLYDKEASRFLYAIHDIVIKILLTSQILIWYVQYWMPNRKNSSDKHLKIPCSQKNLNYFYFIFWVWRHAHRHFMMLSKPIFAFESFRLATETF